MTTPTSTPPTCGNVSPGSSGPYVTSEPRESDLIYEAYYEAFNRDIERDV